MRLLVPGWTLSQSGDALGERRKAGVGILVSPRLAACTLSFFPVDERVCSLGLRVGNVVCAMTVQSYQPSWSPWVGFLKEGSLTGRLLRS